MLLYQVSVFLHIVSAIIWVGGMLFLALVVVPATRTVPAAERAALFGVLGRRFRTVGWACIATLLVTGTINLTYRGVTLENLFARELWASSFGAALALKLGVVALLLALSVYHDFVIGPRSVRALARHPGAGLQAGPGAPPAVAAPSPAGPSAEAQRLRRRASLVGRAEAILALAAVALGIMLVRGVPLP